MRNPSNEYRVTWRRPHWSPSSVSPSRKFSHEAALLKFINEKLLVKDPATLIRVDRRSVGEWKTIKEINQ